MNKKILLDQLLNRPTSSKKQEIQDILNTPTKKTVKEDSSDPNPERNMNSHHLRNLRFDDIKSAFKTFKGERNTNVTQWINNFEEQATLFELTEIQKFIFAKRIIEGQAKLFLEYESKATTWDGLANELKEEFGEQINSALIHQQLSERKKKTNETSIEYFYDMLSLGTKGNVDHSAIITYTIDGLPGPTITKNFMYEAKSIKEFKLKLQTFDLIQPKLGRYNNKKQNETYEEMKEKDTTIEEDRCKNCGNKFHDSESCPDKKKGPKCFKCNTYGHLSRFCTNLITITNKNEETEQGD